MKLFRALVATGIAAYIGVTMPAHAAAPESFAPIVEPLMPAVVNISTTQKIHQQAQMMASGMPVGQQGMSQDLKLPTNTNEEY